MSGGHSLDAGSTASTPCQNSQREFWQRVPSGASPKEKQGINNPNLISAREGFGLFLFMRGQKLKNPAPIFKSFLKKSQNLLTRLV